MKSDLDSIHDLLKYEPSTRPPSVEEMVNLANGQFSKKWIKYMYGRFKAECPCGRMKLFEFKKLFSEFLPDRLSDAYLERMFHAICHKTQAQDDITFKDLIQSLAMLQCNDPYLNAEWMMRLINPHSYDRITFDEFHEFVKSIFLLVGRENRTRTNSVLSDDYKIDHSISSPPSVDEMVNLANGQFSKKWIKYMYGRFKAECPCGRMKLSEFKKLFSEFLPDRLSDAYLERMFHAICHKTQAKDDITFKASSNQLIGLNFV
uniref:EF-hand domain-containing protein n=1 Tax=Panagrolaimus sp. JU765 TaxID=591449 RepID=A0AC34QIQ6_9BILA